MKSYKVLVIFAAISLSHSQLDGSFWWQNKKLLKGASESRSINDQNAKIRTLPPRYRKEDEVTTSLPKTSTGKMSIFGSDEDDEEERKMFKYDNEPDCVCTPNYLCSENNTIITDGNGVIDER